MKKHFNTAGPCIPEEHYMLPVMERNAEVIELINRKQFYVIHAARQTGKTTVIRQLAKK